jgi:hypothetical protein
VGEGVASSSFLKKRTKKLQYACNSGVAGAAYAPMTENFFASFCSQKEDLT